MSAALRALTTIVLVTGFGVVAASAGGAPEQARISPQSHEGILLYAPAHGQPFMPSDTIRFNWATTWFHQTNVSRLNFFVGTIPDSGNVWDEYFDCPASVAPSCPTSRELTSFSPGTYWWGVNHEFTGCCVKHSDRWAFVVTDAQLINLGLPNGATFSTTEDVDLAWESNWWSSSSASTLHVFAGTGGQLDNGVHLHFTCPASGAPSCPTSRSLDHMPAGTYSWGVDHEFPGLTMRVGPRRTFQVVERRQALPPPPPRPPSPRIPRGPPRVRPGVAIIGSTLAYGGTSGPDVVDIVRSRRFYFVTQGAGRLAVGRSCVRLDRLSARCPTRGVRSAYANGGVGEDSIAAAISIPATILGGPGDDRLEGGSAGDLLSGGTGDDTVEGGTGRDLLFGSDNDIVTGGPGNDELRNGGSLDGGPGNDALIGDGTNNTLLGGDGDDYLDGGAGNDDVYAGRGTDVLLGGEGGDHLSGERIDEFTLGHDETDIIYCQGGGDLFDEILDAYLYNRVDLSCETSIDSLVGGIGGGYTAQVRTRLHRARGSAPWVELLVLTRAKLDTFNVAMKFVGPRRAALGEAKVESIKGGRWVRVRSVRPPSATRTVEATVLTS